jgi:hypothetical protein
MGPCGFLGRVAVLDYFCYYLCVPMKFPLCSRQVLNEFLTFSLSSWCVPQYVPHSSSLRPKYFALSFTLATYITNPKEKITTYLFWDCWKLDYFFLWRDNETSHFLCEPLHKAHCYTIVSETALNVLLHNRLLMAKCLLWNWCVQFLGKKRSKYSFLCWVTGVN